MKKHIVILSMVLALSAGGCDRIYGLLHKPGGEEREVLGAFVFNEYNPKVEELQKLLRVFGYPLGRPDGKFGASTRDMVEKFQKDEGLETTRFVDKATWAQIRLYADTFITPKGTINGKALQTALKKSGHLTGKADGIIGPKTLAALKSFQAQKGLTADGNIGLKTMKEMMIYLKPAPVPNDGTAPSSTP
jgi:peptidoglycan hydrolase-like protein with peptidoglycan-binding domain